MALARAVVAAALLGAAFAGAGCDGCSPTPPPGDGGQPIDQSIPFDLSLGDGGEPIAAGLTMTGCGALEVVNGRPRCGGVAPLALTLVPLTSSGVDTWSWLLPGGVPSSSKAPTPSITWPLPGTFTVRLVVGGPGGTATADGDIVVAPSPTAGPCTVDAQCASSYQCLCGASQDLGTGCSGALDYGLCSRGCDGTLCGVGEVCADLGRTTTTPAPSWRQPLCLPACSGPSDCRPGLVCRQLPALPPGGHSGGTFTWMGACFPPLLDDVPGPCVDANGQLDESECVTGECAALGALGLCTHACGADGACPPTAVCATFNGSAGSLCIPRCDGGHPCGDPLFDCQVANTTGLLGFSVPSLEPKSATYCAPRRCTQEVDCEPAGSCQGLDGGTAFCN